MKSRTSTSRFQDTPEKSRHASGCCVPVSGLVLIWMSLLSWRICSSGFALDSLDESFSAGLHAGGVRLVGVDVHRERKARIHSHKHVAKDEFAVAGDAHAHDRFVAHAVAQCVLG